MDGSRWSCRDMRSVDIALKNGSQYYPYLHKAIEHELERFEEVFLSEAYSHPSRFDISRF